MTSSAQKHPVGLTAVKPAVAPVVYTNSSDCDNSNDNFIVDEATEDLDEYNKLCEGKDIFHVMKKAPKHPCDKSDSEVDCSSENDDEPLYSDSEDDPQVLKIDEKGSSVSIVKKRNPKSDSIGKKHTNMNKTEENELRLAESDDEGSSVENEENEESNDENIINMDNDSDDDEDFLNQTAVSAPVSKSSAKMAKIETTKTKKRANKVASGDKKKTAQSANPTSSTSTATKSKPPEKKKSVSKSTAKDTEYISKKLQDDMDEVADQMASAPKKTQPKAKKPTTQTTKKKTQNNATAPAKKSEARNTPAKGTKRKRKDTTDETSASASAKKRSATRDTVNRWMKHYTNACSDDVDIRKEMENVIQICKVQPLCDAIKMEPQAFLKMANNFKNVLEKRSSEEADSQDPFVLDDSTVIYVRSAVLMTLMLLQSSDVEINYSVLMEVLNDKKKATERSVKMICESCGDIFNMKCNYKKQEMDTDVGW